MEGIGGGGWSAAAGHVEEGDMRKTIGWIWLGVALLGTPAIAAGKAASKPETKAEAAKAAEERWIDLDEVRAAILARIAAILGGDPSEARGTVVPAGSETGLSSIGSSYDCARGTVVPGCS